LPFYAFSDDSQLLEQLIEFFENVKLNPESPVSQCLNERKNKASINQQKRDLDVKLLKACDKDNQVVQFNADYFNSAEADSWKIDYDDDEDVQYGKINHVSSNIKCIEKNENLSDVSNIHEIKLLEKFK
jgi:hypothetical protein